MFCELKPEIKEIENSSGLHFLMYLVFDQRNETKRNDSDKNRKNKTKIFSGLQNLIEKSADSRLDWNGIVSKFNRLYGFILTTHL